MTSLFGMPRERGRWVFVALGLVINLWLGTIYAWSIFVEPLTAHFAGDLGLPVTAGDVLMPFSVYLVCIALVMPFTGRIIETLGPRNGAIAGGVLVGLGWILASVSTSVPMLSVTYGVVGGIGEGLAYSVLVAVAACWFPDRRGLAVGITILGIGFSTFFTAHLADYLVGAFGVMNAFRVLGVAVIILIPLLALPCGSRPRAGSRQGGPPPARSPARRDAANATGPGC
jgi:MFS transporter, OFA family, oxalate/formate antiporter